MPKGNSFPNSAFSYGAGGEYTTGDKFYVSSTTVGASDGNDGKSPKTPLATLNGAMDQVTANNGDIVFLMPGHTEDLDAATDAVIDVAGVKILGLGVGASRPTFTYSGTAGSFEIDAANTHIENVVFKTSVSAVVVGVNVDANDCSLVNCEWNFDATGDDFLIFVDVDGVDGTQIAGCTFVAEDAADSNEAIRLDDSDRTRITDCHFFGDYAAGVIINEGAACTALLIARNTMMNRDTGDPGNGIDLDTACTGLIADNRLGGLSAGDVTTLIDPGSCLCLENYAANAIDESGVLVPNTLSTS